MLAKLFWGSLGLLGFGSVATLAFHRGETISALWLVTAAFCTGVISYRFYSAWLFSSVLPIDENRAPPSIVKEDGTDFVKTDSWVVFGHHFAAIAGPGPLVGPVLAAQFGYLPGMLWILIGAALAGGVHDSMILYFSTRRSGKSLGQMIKEEIGELAGFITLLGILGIMVILIAVLGLVVVRALAESPWGLFTIAMTIPISMLMGGAMHSWAPHRIGLITGLGVIGLFLSVWGGQYLAHWPAAERFLTLDAKTLAWAVIVYGFAASTLPVWLLLAPRDYLSTFMKIGTVGALAGAVIFLAPELQMPALTRFIDGTGPVFAGPVFPFCFITIACGAISGFHALISSGTTPKMINNERCIRRIGYGAMITEMLVAVMALVAACTMEPGVYFSINIKGEPAAVVAQVTAAGFPVTLEQMTTLASDLGEKTMIGRTGGAPTFAVGMAKMFASAMKATGALPLWYHFAIMFEALFILTTIDAGTRVGRFLLQDLLGHITPALGPSGGWLSNSVSSFLFVGAWGWFLYQGVVDPLGGINSLWPIFGIANQLLAVIALSFATVMLVKMGKARYWPVTGFPLLWLLLVTLSAGAMKIFHGDVKIGFLAAARELTTKIAAGGTPNQITTWQHLLFNNQVDAAVTSVFLVLVLLIVGTCAYEIWLLHHGKKNIVLKESEFIALDTFAPPTPFID
ncbi:MAG: carbon starvation CstA family protein [Candidatus Ozemobacteraceae bacterium]